MDALDRINLRLEWARGHLVQLNADAEAFLKSEPYAYRQEQYTNADEKIAEIRLHVIRQPPVELSLVIGDCIHNLRSTLDHLAWELAIRNGTPQFPRAVAFPIFLRESGKEPCFAITAKNMIREIAPEIYPVFEQLQPYTRPDAPESHPLCILNDLWSIDKHRTILLTGYSIVGNRILDVVPSDCVKQIDISAGAFDENAIIARLHISPPNAKLKINGQFEASIVFKEPGAAYGQRVSGLLTELYEFVRDDVVPAFEPYLRS